MQSRSWRLIGRPAAALVLVGALFGASLPARAGGIPSVPPPDDAGSFVGTWYYVDPGYKIAIFISEDAAGAYKIRYHVRDRKDNDYETDALGKAKYVDEDTLFHITFSAKVEGPNRITGRHERLAQDKDGAKVKESGAFEMYRAEYGRKLVVRYPEWKSQTITKTGRIVSTNLQTDVVRLFRRASTIVVDFDEIRF